jgi:hypothetical protein
MINYILKYGRFAILLFLLWVNLNSCREDGTGDPPEIMYVRTTNPSLADSTFTQAHTGQMIVIVGKNLQDTKKIFINDQQIPFNPLYNTATNIIVNIPTEENGFVLTYINPALTPEIRVETDRGIAMYRFKVLYANPTITGIDAEHYPTQTGDEVQVAGNNFVDIQKVYFSNIDPNAASGVAPSTVDVIEITNYTVTQNRYQDPKKGYITESTMTFKLPDLPRIEDNYFGYLVIECAAATASRKYSTLPEPVVTALSSDMPIPGAELTITGLYFIDVEQVNINNGEIIIPPEQMTVTKTSISFIMPSKPSTRCGLTVVARSGATTVDNFYPYENLIVDFDDIPFEYTWVWSTIANFGSDSTRMPYISDGKCGGLSGLMAGSTWWGQQITIYGFASYPSFDIIPAETPLSNVSLVYEHFIDHPSNLSLSFRFPDMEIAESSFETISDDGKRIFGKWAAASIPLSAICGINATTYGDLVNSGRRSLMWHVSNRSNVEENVNFYVDNARIELIPQRIE